VVRSLIKVTDIAHIPYQKIVFYEDEGYKLTFEVEEDFIPVDEDEDMLNAQDGNDDKEDESRNAEQSKDKNSNNKRSGNLLRPRDNERNG
jgi:hypothetical protein